MGIKDEISTEYMKQNDVFADAFNMLVFDGKKVIKPDELQSLDPNLLTLPLKKAMVSSNHLNAIVMFSKNLLSRRTTKLYFYY